MGRAPLGPQGHALVDAEAMLLIDDGEGEIGERGGLLEQRVGADRDQGLAAGQTIEHPLPHRLALAAGEHRHRNPQGRKPA